MTNKLTQQEVETYFKLQDKIRDHVRGVAELCTDICRNESLEYVNDCGDGDISVHVWSQDCGADTYFFPKEYLTMSVDEVKQVIEDKSVKRGNADRRQEKQQEKVLESKMEKVYECAYFEFDNNDPAGCGESWCWCHSRESKTRYCESDFIYAQQFCPFYKKGKLRGSWVVGEDEIEAGKKFASRERKK